MNAHIFGTISEVLRLISYENSKFMNEISEANKVMFRLKLDKKL